MFLICAGDSVMIGGNSTTDLLYNWTPAADLNSTTVSNPVAFPPTTTSYVLTATQQFSGISGSDTVLVTVNHLSAAETLTNAVCYGTNTGTIAVSASLGSGNYTYSWSNGNSTSTDDTLAAGTYTLTVHDNATGCSVVLADTILQPAMPLTANITVPDTLTCIVHSVVLSASSATTGVSYNWSNGISAPADTIALGGNYRVTVTDVLFGFA